MHGYDATQQPQITYRNVPWWRGNDDWDDDTYDDKISVVTMNRLVHLYSSIFVAEEN